jgi:hypothetical protein
MNYPHPNMQKINGQQQAKAHLKEELASLKKQSSMKRERFSRN